MIKHYLCYYSIKENDKIQQYCSVLTADHFPSNTEVTKYLIDLESAETDKTILFRIDQIEEVKKDKKWECKLEKNEKI